MDAQHSMLVGRAKMAAEELRELEDAPTTILEDLEAAEARAEAAEKQVAELTRLLDMRVVHLPDLKAEQQLAIAQGRIAELEAQQQEARGKPYREAQNGQS